VFGIIRRVTSIAELVPNKADGAANSSAPRLVVVATESCLLRAVRVMTPSCRFGRSLSFVPENNTRRVYWRTQLAGFPGL